jgi:hypothetical protein
MPAIRTTPPQVRLSLRYYLWADDGPWRISERVHTGLVAGTMRFAQYAKTRQKVVEVFVRRHRGRPIFARARGIYYRFDESGYLALPAVASIAEGTSARHVRDNLIDIGPAVRHRRWLETQTWKVDRAITRRIATDLSPRFEREDRIPLLKRPR